MLFYYSWATIRKFVIFVSLTSLHSYLFEALELFLKLGLPQCRLRQKCFGTQEKSFFVEKCYKIFNDFNSVLRSRFLY